MSPLRAAGVLDVGAIGAALGCAFFMLAMATNLGLGDTTRGQVRHRGLQLPGEARHPRLRLRHRTSGWGGTSRLNRWGQQVLMVGMVVGRIGILLLLTAIDGNRPHCRARYSRDEIQL